MPVAIGPGPEFFQDPSGLPARRIRQPIAERLRPGRLLLGVAGIPFSVMLNSLQRSRLFGCGLPLDIGPRRHRKRDVNADAMLGVQRTKRTRDRRSPIAALRGIAL